MTCPASSTAAICRRAPERRRSINQWLELTGMKLYEGFGQTEELGDAGHTSSGSSRIPAPRASPRRCMNIQLVDDSGGNVCEDGEEGAIAVTGLKEAYPPAGLFTGYFHDEEKTQREAWAAPTTTTGDMAWRDCDGYCWSSWAATTT